MTNTMSANAPKTPHRSDRISIQQRAGIWRVSLNGKFFGDYVRRDWALEAAFEEAEAIAARGGAATVTWAKDGQEAMLNDTRRPTTLQEAKRVFKSPEARRWPLIGERFARRLLEQAQR
jgi:hypothetical protein